MAAEALVLALGSLELEDGDEDSGLDEPVEPAAQAKGRARSTSAGDGGSTAEPGVGGGTPRPGA